MEELELIRKAKTGDYDATEEIMRRYKNFVKLKSRAYFLKGADKEDIIQEGMIGLYKAIRDFDESKTSSFRCFAEVCITRQMITAVKTATRKKHTPLNNYVSLSKPIYDDESERTLLDIITLGMVSNPEELIISREKLEDIEDKINELLSELEQEVLRLYLNGRSYQQIAERIGKDVKSIDNALQRVKKKLEKHLENINN